MMRWLIPICLFAGWLWAKPTRQGRTPGLELSISFESPAAADLESQLVVHPEVLKCLRLGARLDADFMVDVTGEVSASKRLENLEITSLGLRKTEACLDKTLRKYHVEGEAIGPFHLRLERVHPGGSKFKTFILDLNRPKALE